MLVRSPRLHVRYSVLVLVIVLLLNEGTRCNGKRYHRRKQRTLKFHDCGLPGKSIAFHSIDARPLPLRFPGSVRFGINMTILKHLPAQFGVELTVKSKTAFGSLMLTCREYNGFKFGSCRYNNICEWLHPYTRKPESTRCRKRWLTAGVPCECPAHPGNIVVRNLRFNLPFLTEYQKIYLPKRKRIQFLFFETSTLHRLGCLSIWFSSVDNTNRYLRKQKINYGR